MTVQNVAQISDIIYSVLALADQQSSLVLAVLSHPCIDYSFQVTKCWKKLLHRILHLRWPLINNSWINLGNITEQFLNIMIKI